MEQIVKRWYKKVWLTRGARFNAHSRLEKHANLSSLSILTVYIIALNLFPQISFLKSSFKIDDTGYITIILSVLILSISQYVSSKEYKLKAFKFHSCGKELNTIYEVLAIYNENPGTVSLVNIENIANDYQNIINKCEENHSKLDLHVFYSDNVKEFPQIKYPILFGFMTQLFHLKEFIIYWIFIATPPLIFISWLIFKHS